MKRKFNIKKTIKLLSFLLSIIVYGGLLGCSEDFSHSSSFPHPDLSFNGYVDNGSSIDTRSGEIIPINPDDFGETVFYIYEKGIHKDQNNPDGTLKATVGNYWLESGAEGQLDTYRGNTELNWFAADTRHRFWSWTWPLEEKDYSDVDLDKRPEDEVIIFIHSDLPLPGSKEDSKTKGEGDENSSDTGNPLVPDNQTEAQLWRNGEALERLVGTISDREYVFNEDGRYVPLTYKHLVSRIILGDFWLVDNTGATQKDLKARITFYGMPKRAMFYPLPQPVNGKEVAPYVIIDPTDPYGKTKDKDTTTPEVDIENKTWTYNLSEYLTFYITNEGGDDTNTGTNPDADSNVSRDIFYICPEVDFSHLQYKVEFVEFDKESNKYIPHSKYGTRGGYFGDFMSVQFVRGEAGSEQTTTDRVLHAGEEMVLNMTVYQKSGPGAGVWIRNWDSEKLKSATHHEHPGIYSDAEASAFRTVMQQTGKTDEINEQKREAYDMYGEDEDINKDGQKEKVVHLYSDINLSSNTFLIYPVEGESMVLDGMGYTITFTNTSSTDSTPYTSFRIGNVRDVYITNGIYTLYINPEGQICRLNKETGEYEVTGESWTPNSTSIPFEDPRK